MASSGGGQTKKNPKGFRFRSHFRRSDNNDEPKGEQENELFGGSVRYSLHVSIRAEIKHCRTHTLVVEERENTLNLLSGEWN